MKSLDKVASFARMLLSSVVGAKVISLSPRAVGMLGYECLLAISSNDFSWN
jgi:hypothetical protein